VATQLKDDESQFLQDSFQQQLSRWNRRRLSPAFPDDWSADRFNEDQRMLRLEHGFIAWFEGLKASGPGQHDRLFPWLAEEAQMDHLRWFLSQEAAGEAGFDDLVAMTQVKLPDQAKMELARNYWDEMGRGNIKGMHGPMLGQLVDLLDLDTRIDHTVWESLALANAMTAMATQRCYAWHSVGALGVIELTAPDRSAHTAKALRRLGLSNSQRRYFDLHAVLDIKHSADWNEEAIKPLVAEDPRRATAMAEGALIRLRCGARCFDRYRAHFGLE